MASERETQIIDAAGRLFYKKGFHNVGMDDIGGAVGISGPAIYKHFSGKDEILATLLNDAIDEIISRTAPDADPHVELEHLLQSQSEFAVNHRELVSVYTRDDRELQMPWKRSFQRRAAKHAEDWVKLLRRSYPDVPESQILVTAYSLIGMIHSVARWPTSLGRGDLEVETLFRLAQNALGALDDIQAKASGDPASNGADPAAGSVTR